MQQAIKTGAVNSRSSDFCIFTKTAIMINDTVYIKFSLTGLVMMKVCMRLQKLCCNKEITVIFVCQ